MNDETLWEHLTELFDRLLASTDPAAVLASESDPELRRAAEELWRHHVSASSEEFLDTGMEFSVRPVFQSGQLLSNRFRIQNLIGRGGMGEVYLAIDERMEVKVALKTIARLLSPSPSLRRRIVAEVQSARRVTHPNICRIHELFDDGETVFFTMEHLEGKPLSQLMDEPLDRKASRLIVRQLAEGLHAAHRTGVVHGDFKPANVMIIAGEVPRAVIMDFGLACALDRSTSAAERMLSVRAGTAEYMAPELAGASGPTVRSDIYAFGKVARALVPDDRIWDECVRPAPEDRPATLEPILLQLSASSTRRFWLGGAILVAAGAGSYAVWRPQTPLHIPQGARLLVNGFRTAAEQLPAARLARGALLTALFQSPRLRAIQDQDLLPALRHVVQDATLPLAGQNLLKLMALLRASFWVDADLRHSGSRYSLNVQLIRASDQQVMGETSFRDISQVVNAAQLAARWLRSAAGESTRSLENNPVAVATYTSEVPEALQKYYDAMEHAAVGEMEDAVPLLEEAVRLDPGFAQARCTLGLALNSLGKYEEAYLNAAEARDIAIRRRLPERERARIDSDYWRLTEDPAEMVRAARQNRDYFPDEPRSYRILAWTLAHCGTPREAIEHSRKALEYSPADDLLRSDLINNLAEAGQFEDARREFEEALRKGVKNRWIYGSGGLAYLGLEEYGKAREAFENEPEGSFRTVDIQRARVLSGDLELAISQMHELRAAATNSLELHKANEFLTTLYFLTDRPDLALPAVRAMADLAPYPQMARRLDCAAFWAARLGDTATLAAVHDRSREIAARWPNRLTTAVDLHVRALKARSAGSQEEARNLLLDAEGSAFTVWTLFDLADIYTALSQPEVAGSRWKEFEEHRGTVLSFWCPGVLVLSWFHRAQAAHAGNDPAARQKYSKKILDHWGQKNPRLRIVQLAGNLNTIN